MLLLAVQSGRYWVFVEEVSLTGVSKPSLKGGCRKSLLDEVFCKSESPAPNGVALSGGRREYVSIGLAKRSLFLTPPESTTPFGTSVL